MSKRRKRTVAQEQVEEQEDLHKYDSPRRDAFYGALSGASVVGLVITAGNLAVLTVFAISYFFVFTMLLVGIKIEKKPIRLSRPFIAGLIMGSFLLGATAEILLLLP